MTSGLAPPKLLDRVREAIRARHYSRRTDDVYVHWIRRYIVFHNKTHPSNMNMGAASGLSGCAKGGTHQAGELSYVPALVRDAFARGWVRHPDRAGAAGTRGCEHDDDLDARPESRRAGLRSPMDRL
jgi:hypothetical protein